MKVNGKKTKLMIVNFTRNYQLSTRIYLEGELLEIVSETMLLGCVITSDLKFHRNTEHMVKKAYARMSLLHKLFTFKVSTDDLVNIYILYIRSLVEQNVAVWSSTITQEEIEDIERVQKVALRIILKESYATYDSALGHLGLETLHTRRRGLCLRFAKRCLKNEKTASMFPTNPGYNLRVRDSEMYQVKFANNNRLRDSSIPYLQRLLNEDSK